MDQDRDTSAPEDDYPHGVGWWEEERGGQGMGEVQSTEGARLDGWFGEGGARVGDACLQARPIARARRAVLSSYTAWGEEGMGTGGMEEERGEEGGFAGVDGVAEGGLAREDGERGFGRVEVVEAFPFVEEDSFHCPGG